MPITQSELKDRSARAIRLVGGVALFAAVNAAMAAALQRLGVRFPSSVAGMLLTFAGLLVAGRAAPTLTEGLLDAVAPATHFLGRWMALFFAPPLVVLPAADLPQGAALGKLGVLIVTGFVFTLITTAFIARGLAARKERGSAVAANAAETPVSEEEHEREAVWHLLAGWGSLAVVAALAWTAGLRQAAFVFLVAATVAFFLTGRALRQAAGRLLARMPSALLQRALLSLLHPIVVSAGATALTIGALDYSYAQYLGQARSLATAGGLLMAFLAPAVVALGVLLYRERLRMRNYSLDIVLTLAAAALLSLFSAALLARSLGLNAEPALAALPRSVTTPVAIPIAELLGANPGLTAAIVIITGIAGAIFGRPLLDALGIRRAVVRGLAMGASSHGIGTADLVGREPSAAALSGVGFALMAAFSALAVSIPPVYDALRALAS